MLGCPMMWLRTPSDGASSRILTPTHSLLLFQTSGPWAAITQSRGLAPCGQKTKGKLQCWQGMEPSRARLLGERLPSKKLVALSHLAALWTTRPHAQSFSTGHSGSEKQVLLERVLGADPCVSGLGTGHFPVISSSV